MSPAPSTPPQTFESLSPRSLLAYYVAKFRAEIALQLAYRGAVVIWLVGLVVQPLVSLLVWTSVARSNGGEAGGFTSGEYAAYFITLMVVNHLTFIWHMWEFGWRIQTGFFTPHFLRPIHPIHNDVVENLSFKVVGLVGIVPAAIILAIVFDADFSDTTTGTVAAFVPALLLAMALRFILEWTLALAAFWMTKVSALNNFYGFVSFFLAGMVAPLALLPEPARILANVLPFRWTVSFPIEVLLGQVGAGTMALGIGLQVAWIALAALVLRRLWAVAAARYTAVGA
ncbi:MAG TPA: ABC-2 family transporter protein [Thermomicrobiales bacterium]|nr:ABC-2 family transporter protein [Thermomicrobiales bacterium]